MDKAGYQKDKLVKGNESVGENVFRANKKTWNLMS